MRLLPSNRVEHIWSKKSSWRIFRFWKIRQLVDITWCPKRGLNPHNLAVEGF